MSDYKFHLNGMRGLQLFVYEDRVVFCVKAGITAFFSRSTPHETTLYFKDCLSISYKKSGWNNGYIMYDTAGDHYTFTWDNSSTNDMAIRAAEYCKQRITEIKMQGSSATASPAPSSADELLKYKQLLDMGAITQQEFDKKKKEILG